MSKIGAVVAEVTNMYEDGCTTMQIALELDLPITSIENIIISTWDYEDMI